MDSSMIVIGIDIGNLKKDIGKVRPLGEPFLFLAKLVYFIRIMNTRINK